VLTRELEASDGVDGRVSIEVDPRLANDTDKTIAQAVELWKIVDRPNLFIKIPATKAGLPAITAVLAEGISVNVTLIFSVERHREVMDAYLAGLEKAREAGHDLSKIHSVASFFVSRVDTEVDKRLEKIGSPDALALRGQAGVANARLAYAAYQEVFHDGPGELTRARQNAAWYPDDVWRYVLACQWQRIDQEEPFPGRCAEAGDELRKSGLRVHVAKTVMRTSEDKADLATAVLTAVRGQSAAAAGPDHS